MQTQVESRKHVSPAAVPVATPRRQSLNSLSLLDSTALETLFAAAEAVPLDALQGHPRGRVLAIPGLDRGLVAALVRGLHASRWWPWEGKSFSLRPGAAEGAGINRALLPIHRGLFSFRTYAAASVVDGKPCFAIDYDVPENPFMARPIYDEVRKVDDQLYLGRGMRRRPGRQPKLVLWFALDSSLPDRPVDIPQR
jgi:hypothetical protein